jgi:hypothetical protein
MKIRKSMVHEKHGNHEPENRSRLRDIIGTSFFCRTDSAYFIRIVWERSGPTDTNSIGLPTSSSIERQYC